jgi:hypothetical protein
VPERQSKLFRQCDDDSGRQNIYRNTALLSFCPPNAFHQEREKFTHICLVAGLGANGFHVGSRCRNRNSSEAIPIENSGPFGCLCPPSSNCRHPAAPNGHCCCHHAQYKSTTNTGGWNVLFGVHDDGAGDGWFVAATTTTTAVGVKLLPWLLCVVERESLCLGFER